MRYTTDELVAAIKLSGFIPASDNTFTDANLIQLMNEEMQNKIVPHILSVRQNFFLTSKQDSVTSNLPSYTMPERAIGSEIQDLWYIPDTSNPTDKYPIAKASSPHEIRSWSGGGNSPSIYYLQGDQAIMVPTPVTTVSALLWYYYRRVSQLVPVSDCAKITSVAVGASTTVFTVDTDQSASWTTSTDVDFVSGKSPHLSWADDVTITAITSTTITVANSDIQNVVGGTLPQVGDYICEARMTCVPQVPEEFHVILAEMGVYRCLKALGAKANLEMVAANIRDMLDRSFKMIANRVDDSVDVVIERNSIASTSQSSFNRFTSR